MSCDCCDTVNEDRQCCFCYSGTIWDVSLSGQSSNDIEFARVQPANNIWDTGTSLQFSVNKLSEIGVLIKSGDDSVNGGCAPYEPAFFSCQDRLDSGFPSHLYCDPVRYYTINYDDQFFDFADFFPYLSTLNRYRDIERSHTELRNGEPLLVTGSYGFETPNISGNMGKEPGPGERTFRGPYNYPMSGDYLNLPRMFIASGGCMYGSATIATMRGTGDLATGSCGDFNSLSLSQQSTIYNLESSLFSTSSKRLISYPNAYGFYRYSIPNIITGGFVKEYTAEVGFERVGDNTQDNSNDWLVTGNLAGPNSNFGGIGSTFTIYDDYSGAYRRTYYPSTFSSHFFNPGRVHVVIRAKVDGGVLYNRSSNRISPTVKYEDRPLEIFITSQGSPRNGNFPRRFWYGVDRRRTELNATIQDIYDNDGYTLQMTMSGISGYEGYQHGDLTGIMHLNVAIPELNYSGDYELYTSIPRCGYGEANATVFNHLKAHQSLDGEPLYLSTIDRIYSKSPFIELSTQENPVNRLFGDPPPSATGSGIYKAFEGTHFSLEEAQSFCDYTDNLASGSGFDKAYYTWCENDIPYYNRIPGQFTSLSDPPIGTGTHNIITQDPFYPAGGTIGRLCRLALSRDDFLQQGLVFKEAIYSYANGEEQRLHATGFDSFSIPNETLMTLTGTPTTGDLFEAVFDNLGADDAIISGVTLSPTSGTPTGILSSVDPLSGTVSQFQVFTFDFNPYSGLDSGNFSGVYRTDITFDHNADKYMIDSPFFFSILGSGLGADTSGGPQPTGSIEINAAVRGTDNLNGNGGTVTTGVRGGSIHTNVRKCNEFGDSEPGIFAIDLSNHVSTGVTYDSVLVRWSSDNDPDPAWKFNSYEDNSLTGFTTVSSIPTGFESLPTDVSVSADELDTNGSAGTYKYQLIMNNYEYSTTGRYLHFRDKGDANSNVYVDSVYFQAGSTSSGDGPGEEPGPG